MFYTVSVSFQDQDGQHYRANTTRQNGLNILTLGWIWKLKIQIDSSLFSESARVIVFFLFRYIVLKLSAKNFVAFRHTKSFPLQYHYSSMTFKRDVRKILTT